MHTVSSTYQRASSGHKLTFYNEMSTFSAIWTKRPFLEWQNYHFQWWRGLRVTTCWAGNGEETHDWSGNNDPRWPFHYSQNNASCRLLWKCQQLFACPQKDTFKRQNMHASPIVDLYHCCLETRLGRLLRGYKIHCQWLRWNTWLIKGVVGRHL